MKRFAGDWISLRTEYLETCGLPLYLNAVVGQSGIVMLDSGVADTPKRSLVAEPEQAGLRIEDIGLVVNSHAHPDHMGGNSALKTLASPVFAAPVGDASWLEGQRPGAAATPGREPRCLPVSKAPTGTRCSHSSASREVFADWPSSISR
jgi:glyoxylase-like metal-dependent hydrolase (beta-lactamase superfamily II)